MAHVVLYPDPHVCPHLKEGLITLVAFLGPNTFVSWNLSSPIRLQDCQSNRMCAPWYVAINMSIFRLSATVVRYCIDSAHCTLLPNLLATKDPT